MMKMTIYAGLIATLSVVIQGCSSTAKYGCQGFPDGVKCRSTRDVYLAGTSSGYDIASDIEVMEKSPNARKGANITRKDPSPEELARQEAMKAPSDIVLQKYVNARLPDSPIPIRTPAQVMRIWIAPYEDKAGDLVVPGLVYTDIKERKWVIGRPVESKATQLKPLQSRHYEKSARGGD